nr:hypothetical protein [uncultured bacterium]
MAKKLSTRGARVLKRAIAKVKARRHNPPIVSRKPTLEEENRPVLNSILARLQQEA